MKTITPKLTLLVSAFLAIFCAFGAKAQISAISANPNGNPSAVYVVYSTSVDSSSSTATGNYVLSNTITTATVPIASATLAPDNVTVQLNLGSSLQITNNYTLFISNVKDATLTYTISPNPTIFNFWYGGNPNGATFTFDDGLVPANTWLSSNTVDTAGNGVNPYLSVTNIGGVGDSGMLILTAVTGNTHWLAPTNTRANVANGQAFSQWHIGDLANGHPITNMILAFDLFYGNGSGGNTTNLNTDVNHEGANGFVFHWGPGLDPNGPDQYTGGASSWGQGLDVDFRIYSSTPNFPGVNLFYGQNAGAGANTPIATNAFLDYFTGNLTNTWPGYTNDPTQIGFSSNYTHIVISINVTNSATATNALVSVTCSNAWIGVTNIEWYFQGNDLGNTMLIPNFNMSLVTQPMAFTATDGAGGHSDGFLDNADFTINGVHITTPVQVGPVSISAQPASQAVSENVYATFSVGASGAPPYYYQWYSNSVPIVGANSSSYATPLTLYSNTPPLSGLAMGSNVVYYCVVSNNFSTITSSNAVLTITKDTSGIQPVSVGSVDGNSVGVLFNGFIDTVSAGNPANYRINGGAVGVGSVYVRTNFQNFGNPVFNYTPSYLTTVTLTNSTPLSGNYTVTVSVGNSILSRTGIQVPQTSFNGVVDGLTDADLGSPGSNPLSPGQAFSGGSNLLEIVAGGSDVMSIGTNNPDAGNWAYLQRNGSFDEAADLTWETPTASNAKGGIMIRSSTSDSQSPAISEVVFPAPTAGANTYETAARTNEAINVTSWSATGVAANGHVAANWAGSAPTNGNSWVRIRRVGPYFNGYAAPDGVSWTLIATTFADTNDFPPAEFVGLVASAGNNDGRYNESDFKNFGPVSFPGAVVSFTQNLATNTVAPENAPFPLLVAAKVTGGTALQSDIVYQWQRAESNNPTVFNNIFDGTGNTNLYITPPLSIANDNGAKYRCIAWVGDIGNGQSATSVVTTLSVIIDTNPPYMTAASADSTFQTVTIDFNKGMNQSTLLNSANYSIVAGSTNVSICGVTATANALGLYTNVVLTLCTPLASGVQYQLAVSNLQDLSGNNINGTAVTGGHQRTVTGWMLVMGYLLYERWDGPSYPSGAGPYNSDVTNLVGSARFNYNPNANNTAAYFTPASPDQVELITYSGYPNGDISNPGTDLFDFGARISGLVNPPVTGSYTLFVRGNDGTALFASPDSTRADETYVADANVGYTAPGPSWAFGTVNVSDLFGLLGFPNSVSISMTNGNFYYVEALEQQGNGTSWLEFTWGNPDPIGFDTGVLTNLNYASQTDPNTLTNTAGGAYPIGTAPACGGAPTNAWNITGTNIAVYADPDLSTITATGLTNTTVLAGNSATLSVSASAILNLGTAFASEPVALSANNIQYQWYSNSVAIAGATNSSYTTATFATYAPPNTNFNYSVMITAASPVQIISFMTLTTNVVVTELPNPPTIVSAGSFGGNMIGIQYSRLIDPTTSTNPANYTIVGCAGATVSKVTLLPNGKTVLLTLSGTLCDGSFTVDINNVKDTVGDTISANTPATGSVLYTQLTAADVGVATATSGSEPLVLQTNAVLTNVTFNLSFSGIAVSPTNGVLQVTAGGQGLGVNGLGTNAIQDGFNYLYQQQSGDFDVAVHVELIGGSDSRAKAGLLMRDSLNPGAREYAIVVDPAGTNAADGSGAGYNGVETIERTTTNAAMASFPTVNGANSINSGPNPPVLRTSSGGVYDATGVTNMYPVWLRMRHTGSNVYIYTSRDGTNWYLCARDDGSSANWPSTFYLGLVTTAGNQTNYTQSQFTHYGNYVAPNMPQALMLSGGDVGGTGNQIGLVNGGSYGSPSALDTPAGNPNAPALQITSSTYMYNLLIGMGYNVTVVHAATSATEDGVGKTLVMWGGDCQSGDTSSNGKWVALAVPQIAWKYSSYEKNYWIGNSSDRGNPSSKTFIQIVNTNNPIVQGMYPTNQQVAVVNTPQYFSYATSNDLAHAGTGFTVVAVDPATPANALLYYADVGTTLYSSSTGAAPTSNTYTNKTPARRVGLWMGDNSSAPVGDWSQSTTAGLQLLTNAINWAVAITTNAPVLTGPANQAALVGNSATFSVTAGGSGPGPYSYQWSSNGVLIAGATYPDYTTPATTLANNGNVYQVAVTGLYGSSTNSAALTVQTGVGITSQPQSVTNALSSTAMFSVGASGTSPTYQWYSNNVAIVGATGSSYTTPTLTTNFNGVVYKVVVANLVSSLTSSNATLTVVAGGLPGFSALQFLNGQLIVSWSNASTLLSSTNLLLPLTNWSIVPGASSPYTNSATNNQTFFILKQ